MIALLLLALSATPKVPPLLPVAGKPILCEARESGQTVSLICDEKQSLSKPRPLKLRSKKK